MRVIGAIVASFICVMRRPDTRRVRPPSNRCYPRSPALLTRGIDTICGRLASVSRPDADFGNVTAQWWKGRAELEKNHAYLHGTIDVTDTTGVTVPARAYGIFKVTTLSFTSREVRFVRPDLAIVHASWRMTDDARTPEPRTGLMTLVLTTQSGSWQIVAVHNIEIARTVR